MVLEINPANGFWGTHCLSRGTPSLCEPFPGILVGMSSNDTGIRSSRLASIARSLSLLLALKPVFLLLFLLHKRASDFLPIAWMGCEDGKVKHFGGDQVLWASCFAEPCASHWI